MSNHQGKFMALHSAALRVKKAREELADAQSEERKAAYDIAEATCPFEVGETITLPYHRGKHWKAKARIIEIIPSLSRHCDAMYDLVCVPFKQDGSDSLLHTKVGHHHAELEKRHGKKLSVTWADMKKICPECFPAIQGR